MSITGFYYVVEMVDVISVTGILKIEN